MALWEVPYTVNNTLSMCGFIEMFTNHANSHQSFRDALDTKYLTVKIRTASDWTEVGEAMRSCLQAYPLPVEA
jgi:hypothetical protein